MTNKLYYDALYQASFEAKIVSQEERNEKIWVVLDQTLFYPGGGGQPCDHGTLGGIEVEQFFEQDGIIYHVLSQRLPNGNVQGKIDWERRFELMQQHLGQHILSAIFVRDYALDTVGLRLERDSLSIDLDGYINDDKIALAESAANEIIYQNIPVEVLFPTLEEIRQNSKRPIPDTSDSIRIIKIGDLDYTPCCGLQNKATGEVGIIKVQNHSTHKSGTRIHFLCGRPALRRMDAMCKSYAQMQGVLSCAEQDVAERVCKQHNELQEYKIKNASLMKRLAASDARQLISTAPIISEVSIVSCVLSDTSQEEMKMLYAELTKDKGVVALLGGATPSGAYLMFGCHKAEKRIDVREAFKSALSIIDGKGGGGASYAQGFGANNSKLQMAIHSANEVLKNGM